MVKTNEAITDKLQKGEWKIGQSQFTYDDQSDKEVILVKIRKLVTPGDTYFSQLMIMYFKFKMSLQP